MSVALLLLPTHTQLTPPRDWKTVQGLGLPMPSSESRKLEHDFLTTPIVTFYHV